jgi:tetratricopeptide (TPR) repeat protein
MDPAPTESKPPVQEGLSSRLLAVYRDYLQADAPHPEEWFQLGNHLHADRHYVQAADCYRRCLDTEPRLAEAHYNLGNTCLDLGRHEDARRSFLRCLDLRPDYGDAHFNLGIACFEARRLDEAIAVYRRALELKPDWVEVLYNLGIACHEYGLPGEAVAAFRKTLELKPDFPEACNNLGIALKDQNALEEAAAWFQRAVALRGDYADALYNLGGVRHEQHRVPEAMAAYRAAIAVSPDCYKACNNLAKAHQDQGDIEAAIDWYRRALSVKPDYGEARFNLSTARLLKGDFLEAWKDYEWRFQRSDWRRVYPRRFDKPRWNGESFAGRTLLIHCEQGFGDMLQFARYVPMVKARGGTVILETRQAVLRLFEGLRGVDRLVLFSQDHPPAVDFDSYVPLLSLPGIFRTSLDTIPGQVPYLEAEPSKVSQWRSRIAGGELRVGLVWAGTATDPRRASPLAWFAPLASIEGIKIFGLQKGPAADLLNAEGPPKGMLIDNIGRELEDFSDTAAAVENLDVLVTIDTSVAHLAGALGKPVYLLLPDIPDWRWMLNRDDSPWYPTMRLFRQETAGDWGPPLTRIGRRLDSLARNLLRALAGTGASGLITAAAQLHTQGNLIEALIFFRRLLQQAPDHPEGLHGEGVIALQTGNPTRAVDLIKGAIDRSPNSDRYYYNLGLAFLSLGRRGQAAHAFQNSLDLNPLNADAEFNLNRLNRIGF